MWAWRQMDASAASQNLSHDCRSFFSWQATQCFQLRNPGQRRQKLRYPGSNTADVIIITNQTPSAFRESYTGMKTKCESVGHFSPFQQTTNAVFFVEWTDSCYKFTPSLNLNIDLLFHSVLLCQWTWQHKPHFFCVSVYFWPCSGACVLEEVFLIVFQWARFSARHIPYAESSHDAVCCAGKVIFKVAGNLIYHIAQIVPDMITANEKK